MVAGDEAGSGGIWKPDSGVSNSAAFKRARVESPSPHDLVEVEEWVEAVEEAGCDQAEDGSSGLGVGVAAVEHPVLAADGDLAQPSFGARVVERQVAVVY